MNCPRCQSNLVLGERNGVEIDYCESCRGVWLDAGEIDKIIERSARQFGDASGQNDDPMINRMDDDRRESWWERLLDVFD